MANRLSKIKKDNINPLLSGAFSTIEPDSGNKIELSGISKLSVKLRKALQTALRFRKQVLENGIYGKDADNHLKARTNSKLPEVGLGFESTLKKAEIEILENCIRLDHPKFIGHMTSKVPDESHAADILISIMNQNAVKVETGRSATWVEMETISWFHQLCFGFQESFYPEHQNKAESCLGSVVSGGTIGNLTGLLVARNRSLPKVDETGMGEALVNSGFSKVVVLCSNRGHYSLKKVCMTLGLGSRSLECIPVEKNSNKISIQGLKNRIAQLKSENCLILAMVGVAGSTETGSCDPLKEMAEVSKKHGIWFHVDAAWGGAFLLSDKLKSKLSGIEHADSVVIDGHKLIGQTMGHGMVLFKNPASLQMISHSSRYIIRSDSFDSGRFTIEGSKPFNSFSTWFLLHSLGRKKLGERIEKSFETTKLLANFIENDPDFESTSYVETNILTYRYFPSKLKFIYINSKDSNLKLTIHKFLNRLNTDIQKCQLERGNSFVSRTSLESVENAPEGSWSVVLRAIPFNPETKAHHLLEVLSEQKEIAKSIYLNCLESMDLDDKKLISKLFNN